MTAAEIIKLASEKGWGFTGVYLTKNGMSILPEDWWAEGAPENYDSVMSLEQERDQLKARVTELEKAILACINSTNGNWQDDVGDLSKVVSLSPSSALARLQELERKASMSDEWKNCAEALGNDYRGAMLHDLREHTLKTSESLAKLKALQSAMEKQK